jgi:RluA family pseudouridine synthase
LATYRFKSPQNLHKERFDKVVHTLLNEQVEGGVSKAMARKLVMAGAAYLAGSRCRIASKPVWSGTEVRVEYDANRAKKIDNPVVNLTLDCILYEQAGILVVDKPAGLPTVATLDDARQNLVAMLEALLEKRTGDQGGEHASGKPVYLGVHHRLDAQTSGCILFTTDQGRNGFVSRLFQEHLVQKEYLAIVTVTAKAPPQAWEVKDQLVRAAKKKNRYASTRKLGIPDAEGSFAYSRFELLEHKGELALIRCIPVTGRTHQLRVHLSEYGLPIVGDRLYGAKRTLESPGRLMLHSYRLAFREEDGREVALEAPVPGEFKRLFDLKSL